MTTTTRTARPIEYQVGARWLAVSPDREAAFIAKALTYARRVEAFAVKYPADPTNRDTQRAAGAAFAASLQSEADVRAALANGREIRIGTNWDAEIRDAGVAATRQAETSARFQELQARMAPRFTCRQCGDHRDTTFRGHCDDCES